MKLKNKQNYKNLVIWIDKKTHPMCNFEHCVWGTILEKIKETGRDIFSMDEIFESFTFKRKERFVIISGLIKKKVIKRQRIRGILYKYECIEDSCPSRIYPSINKKQRHKLIKEFS